MAAGIAPSASSPSRTAKTPIAQVSRATGAKRAPTAKRNPRAMTNAASPSAIRSHPVSSIQRWTAVTTSSTQGAASASVRYQDRSLPTSPPIRSRTEVTISSRSSSASSRRTMRNGRLVDEEFGQRVDERLDLRDEERGDGRPEPGRRLAEALE